MAQRGRGSEVAIVLRQSALRQIVLSVVHILTAARRVQLCTGDVRTASGGQRSDVTRVRRDLLPLAPRRLAHPVIPRLVGPQGVGRGGRGAVATATQRDDALLPVVQRRGTHQVWGGVKCTLVLLLLLLSNLA